MKKSIVLCLVLTLVCLFLFGACNEQDQQCKILQTIVADDYKSATVTIKSTFDVGSPEEETLTSTFVMSTQDNVTDITYTIQQYAKFDLSGNVLTGRIEQIVGSAKIKDGRVEYLSGNQTFDSPLPLEKLTVKNLNFKDIYLDNIVQTDTTFSADVTNTSAVVGIDGFVALDMKVNATFTSTQSVLTITYTTPTATVVEISYDLK